MPKYEHQLELIDSHHMGEPTMELKNRFNKAESGNHLPSGVSIQPREPDMSALRNTPKLWFGGNPRLTIFNNVFSLYIPRGELFFIRSVRYYKDQIKDPELQAMITAFMQQETLHSKAHDAFNESFKNHGFDVDKELEYINRHFDWVEKWVPKRIQLGMTVFFEHLTASMAEGAFEIPKEESIIPLDVKEFFQWHAAEELEHKNVAFDVLTEIGGGYVTRMVSAILGPLLMLPAVRKTGQRMRKVYNESMTEENKQQMKEKGEADKRLKKQVRKYYSPSFHPWKQDDREILKQWYESISIYS